MNKAKNFNFIYNGTPELLSGLLCAAGVFFPMPCGGRGACGKCRVKASGALSEPDEREKELLSSEELENGIRLACRAYAVGDVSVTVETQSAIQSLDAAESAVPLPEHVFAAADIGTTTLSMSVCDEMGTVLREKTVLNPQTAFGADVLSRLDRAVKGDGEKLKNAVCDAVSELIFSLCPDVSRLSGLTVTGNTSMLYLLTGENPEPLTHAPFKADELFGCCVPAQLISQRLPADLPVYLAGCASAFVGADVVCSVLAADKEYAFLSGGTNILADIGTNGEIVLSHKGRITACSTAAGPAFEGACLHCGSVACSGAVSKVTLSGRSIVCGVIGGGEGKTLCGSGAIDAVSVMLTAGIIDDTGCILEHSHEFTKYVQPGENGNSFLLPGTHVLITQEDVRNIQLAKSAVCAGILTLLKSAGLCAADLSGLYIAGGFGSFLSEKSAVHIGLIPREAEGRLTVLGNASLRGAQALTLDETRLFSQKLAERTETLELGCSQDFFDEYINNMGFTV